MVGANLNKSLLGIDILPNKVSFTYKKSLEEWHKTDKRVEAKKGTWTWMREPHITLFIFITMFCMTDNIPCSIHEYSPHSYFNTQSECEEYSRILHGILSVPENIVTNLNNVMHINLTRYNWDELAITHIKSCVFLSVFAPWMHKMSINPLSYSPIAQQIIICLHRGEGFEECNKSNWETEVMKGMWMRMWEPQII